MKCGVELPVLLASGMLRYIVLIWEATYVMASGSLTSFALGSVSLS